MGSLKNDYFFLSAISLSSIYPKEIISDAQKFGYKTVYYRPVYNSKNIANNLNVQTQATHTLE